MHVLVADDDGVTRLLLTSVLRKLGHQVAEAVDGTAALASWQEHRQPLIISDWMMPGLSGLEFCREVRADSGTDFTYFILLTARSGEGDYLEGMNAGVDDFIAKPFENPQLGARVRVAERILGLHENLRGANRDLERRVAERTEELATALAVKTEFLSRASHELRTPLNHVLGFGQLLESDNLTTDQAESVEQILTSGRHLLTLIDRILAVSISDPDALEFLKTSDTAQRPAAFSPPCFTRS